MPAQTPSTFRLIGAGVTSVGALAAIFGAGGSNAQTLVNLDTDRAAYLQSKCGHIRDAAESVGCRGQRSIEFDEARAAAARERAKAANETAAAARKEADEHRKATAEHQKAIAKSDAAIAASRTAAQCLSAISAALTANPPRITVAEARAAKTTPTPSDDPCVWRERLAPRLGALTKQ